MVAVASETYTSVSTPIQHAAVRAFRGGMEIERYLWHARRILAALGRECAETLSQAGIQVRRPVGAFYLFLDFSPLQERLAESGIRDGATLCDRLLDEAGIALLPGKVFARPKDELTARLAYVNFDGARALAASEKLPLDEELPPGFISQWCGNTLRGVEALAEWVTS
jgi:aspartate aminotransferase